MNDYEESDLETLYKIRLPKSRINFIRDLLILLMFFVGFAVGLLALGAAQYFFVCNVRDASLTVAQCIRGDYQWKKK